MFYYYQIKGGEEAWQPLPASQRQKFEAIHHPIFMTALTVSKLVEPGMPHEDKLKLAYEGDLYFDWDSKDPVKVIEKTNQFLDKLEALGVDLEMCKLFATGGRGYHLEIPQLVFMERVPKNGTVGLPAIYREMAMALTVDTLDLTIYSAMKGRMWRTCNVKRDNGRYKVPITVAEMRDMTPEMSEELSSSPREMIVPKAPEFCVPLNIEFTRASQTVEELLKRRAKIKPDPAAAQKASGFTVEYMMAGLGFKDGAPFQAIATQLAIAATTAGWKEDEYIAKCAGLIVNHQGDGSRYGTPEKREIELRRMYHYMDGNLCYDFQVGAIKVLLAHSAPDLDGIVTTKEDIKEVIVEAEADAKLGEEEVDEYEDVAKGVTLAKFGVYMDTEFGKKRICAVSFANAAILKSADSSQIVGYGADITVNGAFSGRCTLELDLFSGLVPFNRFVSKYGHAFQGSDAQVRTVMMRFVQQAKKKGNINYVITREGLDIISIPLHDNPILREPFMVWADAKGVVMEPRIEETGVVLQFAGHPDPRGVFRSDVAEAPELVTWIKEGNNRMDMRTMLENLMTCQKPEVLGKLLGWYTACFYKQFFQKHYLKFPLLHINGPAGLGKTEMQTTISSLFYWRNDSRPLSPGTTNFGLTQHLQASSSIPLILDEYKPHEMLKPRHDALKMMFRDAYNQRDVARGGGTRESEDYRTLQFTQMSAPLAFIAEAAESEAAVMERVVLVTFARPAQSIGSRNLARFQAFRRNKHYLGILGQHLAEDIIKNLNTDKFVDEFDALYAAAQKRYMFSEADLGGDMDSEEMQNKQNTKERPVFNHTVAQFGFRQFRRIVQDAVGNSLDGLMSELEDGIFSRLADMHAATTPEYVKVLKEISSMSYHVENERPDAIRKGMEYAFSQEGQREVLELSVHNAYTKYRMYSKSAGMNPLFQGPEAFAHAIKDSPAFIKMGMGNVIQAPRTFLFDAQELLRLGVDAFKKT